MDMKQVVEIPLEEYLELQELKKHEKLVKWEDTTIHFYNGRSSNQTSSGSQWKSDGAVWTAIASKQRATSQRLENVHRSLREFFSSISNMSFRELLKLRKDVRKLCASEKDGDAKAVNHFIEGWE
jgi:hypothetical protein